MVRLRCKPCGPMDTGDISQVAAIVRADASALTVLAAVRSLHLPDGWVGAGFVRNRVWDHLSGVPVSPFNDIDVVYFDPADPEGRAEAMYEARLQRCVTSVQWQVRNQVRMHLRNGDAPYRDVADAVSHWLETPTAVAVRLGESDRIEVLAPCGVEDLLSLICRPTASGRAKIDDYRKRISDKGWTERWPGLRVLET